VHERQLRERSHLPGSVNKVRQNDARIGRVVWAVEFLGGEELVCLPRYWHQRHHAARFLPDLLNQLSLQVKKEASAGFFSREQEALFTTQCGRAYRVAFLNFCDAVFCKLYLCHVSLF